MLSASNRLRMGLPRAISHSCPDFPLAGWHRWYFLNFSSYVFIIKKHLWSMSTMTDGSVYIIDSRSSCTHATWYNTTWVCIPVGTSAITLRYIYIILHIYVYIYVYNYIYLPSIIYIYIYLLLHRKRPTVWLPRCNVRWSRRRSARRAAPTPSWSPIGPRSKFCPGPVEPRRASPCDAWIPWIPSGYVKIAIENGHF